MSLVLSILMGGFGWLKSIITKHWKIALAVAAAVIVFFYAQHKLHEYGEAQFKRGVDATLEKMKGEVAKRDTVNRAIEKRAQDGLDGFAADAEHKAEDRREAEAKAKEKIDTAVDSVPMWNSQECAVTPQVLADRNAIRALGPKAPAAEGDEK